MLASRPSRSLLVLVFLLLLLGPLSGSLHSASGVIRLTAVGDVDSFAWSPRGDTLLYTRPERAISLSATRQQTIDGLYRVPTTGGAGLELVTNANLLSPSPAGTQIAFLAVSDDGTAQLKLLDLASATTRDLGLADRGTRPQWTRSGNELVYAGQGRAQALELNGAGTSRRVLDTRTLPPQFATSPQGDRIAYVAADGLHLLTAGKDTLAFSGANGKHVGTELRWSHDGNRLAFVVTQDGVNPELWILTANGSNATRILQGQSEFFAGLDWAPDDSNLILTRTPTGSSIAKASEIWRLRPDGSQARALSHNHEEESAPRYSPDGKQIAFLRNGDLWVLTLDAANLPLGDSTVAPAPKQEIPSLPPVPAPPRGPKVQKTPPPSIRVYHRQINSCRNEPDGQIDTIDFETYVKRVVPGEMPPSWPAEALKTQAVAARSYAWFWVLQHTGQAWDVTDWTDYQHMCDTQYPATDAAVDATRGQYGDYGWNVIFAAYGSNNGDPTTNNTWGNPYLLAVDDPVDFMNAVSGNGLGMSQWGADHWASPPYNWNYQQILMHYYTGITVEAPSGGLPDTTKPIGGLLSPWSNSGITSNRMYLRASASDDASGVSTVTFTSQYSDGSTNRTATLTPTYDGNYWNYVYDVSSIPDQAGIVITPNITDASGNKFSGNGLTLMLDRIPPTGTASGPASTGSPDVTLNLNATDTGPGGLTQMAFSNNWVWQGENQQVTNNSGVVVSDPDALNGLALMGQAGVQPAGEWYGPYTTALALGQPYRAYFRLKTDNNTTTSEVALLDVVSNGGTNLLGVKRLRGVDFQAANSYQEFYVDFYPNADVDQELEFRVAYRATASLWLDRVIVTSYPVSYAATAPWSLLPGSGQRVVRVKFIDGAGNVSPDSVVRILLGATPTPTATATSTPTSTPTPTPTPVLTPGPWLPLIEK